MVSIFLLMFLIFTCQEVTGKTEHTLITFFESHRDFVYNREMAQDMRGVLFSIPLSAVYWSQGRCQYFDRDYLSSEELWTRPDPPPSPANTTCDPDLMFWFEGERAYFFLSVNFKEINIASEVTS